MPLIFRAFITYLSAFKHFQARSSSVVTYAVILFLQKGVWKSTCVCIQEQSPSNVHTVIYGFVLQGAGKPTYSVIINQRQRKLESLSPVLHLKGYNQSVFLTHPQQTLMFSSWITPFWRVNSIKIYFNKDLWARLSCLLQCQVKIDDFGGGVEVEYWTLLSVRVQKIVPNTTQVRVMLSSWFDAWWWPVETDLL